jgi:hypothetical protein
MTPLIAALIGMFVGFMLGGVTMAILAAAARADACRPSPLPRKAATR